MWVRPLLTVLALALTLSACRGGATVPTTPTTPTAGISRTMTGLWEVPVGGMAVLSLTQSGDSITGFGHIVDSDATCWDDSQRLPVTAGVIRGATMQLALGSGWTAIHITGSLSADGNTLENTRSTAPGCVVEGYPWEGAGTGVRIVPLAGTFDMRLETYAGQQVRTMTATLNQSPTFGAYGEFAVTGSATPGPDWPCSAGPLIGTELSLHGGTLHGRFSDAANMVAFFFQAPRTGAGSQSFKGWFSGPDAPCLEGYPERVGYVTITKR